MKWVSCSAVMSAALLVLGGCGVISGVDVHEGPVAYLASDPGGVMLLQWASDDQGHLTGSGQVAEPPQDGSDLDTSTFALTGQQDDDDVSLTVDLGLGIKQNWAGVLDGDRLTLDVPHEDGTFAELSFTRSDTRSYTAAVTDLRATIAADQQFAADAAAEADYQEGAAREREARAQAVSTLAADAAALAAGPDLAPMIAAAERALDAVRQAAGGTGSCVDVNDTESVVAVGDAYAHVLDALDPLDSAVADLQRLADEMDVSIDDARTYAGAPAVQDYLAKTGRRPRPG